jgi:hypothetical protein
MAYPSLLSVSNGEFNPNYWFANKLQFLNAQVFRVARNIRSKNKARL